MRIEISSVARFTFPLSKDEVDTLQDLSAHHYDFVCTRAGAEGGFIYGWSNSFFGGATTATVSATWHDLDTCLKIMEASSYLYAEDYKKASTMANLSRSFRAAMDRYSKVSGSWVSVVGNGS